MSGKLLVEVFKFRRERERGGVVILQVPWGKEKGEAAEKGGGREGEATTTTQGGKRNRKSTRDHT